MIRFVRVRGRAPGHVITVNPLLVMSIEPTSWGGSEVNFSDVYCIVSRDNPLMVQSLLEGRVRLCERPLCDNTSTGPYAPLCARCRDRGNGGTHSGKPTPAPDLIVVADRHGFR